MAWGRIGDKPLSESMLTQFSDVYMRYKGEMSFNWPAEDQGEIHNKWILFLYLIFKLNT